MKISFLLAFLLISAYFNQSQAFGITTGICYAGCGALVTACYASAGLIFGTVTAGVGAPVAAIACNAAFGKCMAACSIATALTP